MLSRVNKEVVRWPDEATGLPCVAILTPIGHWCGYVGVPEGHRAYQIDYDNVKRVDGEWIDVHGGLTYADFSDERGAGFWWLGFDCAHCGDAVPGLMEHDGDIFRDLDYVKQECAKLALQLKEISHAAVNG